MVTQPSMGGPAFGVALRAREEWVDASAIRVVEQATVVELAAQGRSAMH